MKHSTIIGIYSDYEPYEITTFHFENELKVYFFIFLSLLFFLCFECVIRFSLEIEFNLVKKKNESKFCYHFYCNKRWRGTKWMDRPI